MEEYMKLISVPVIASKVYGITGLIKTVKPRTGLEELTK